MIFLKKKKFLSEKLKIKVVKCSCHDYHKLDWGCVCSIVGLEGTIKCKHSKREYYNISIPKQPNGNWVAKHDDLEILTPERSSFEF